MGYAACLDGSSGVRESRYYTYTILKNCFKRRQRRSLVGLALDGVDIRALHFFVCVISSSTYLTEMEGLPVISFDQNVEIDSYFLADPGIHSFPGLGASREF